MVGARGGADDLFEASYTYRLQGTGRYLTVVEAQAGSRRYYKAYLADRLDGTWTPLAGTWDSALRGGVQRPV